MALIVDTHEMGVLADDLVRGAEALMGTSRAAVRDIGRNVAGRAQSIAAGYGSTSIPGTIHGFDRGREYVVQAGGEGVPIAGLWEYGNRGGGSDTDFEHPVFGNQNAEVRQQRHPFLRPAVAEAEESMIHRGEHAYDEAFAPVDLRPI